MATNLFLQKIIKKSNMPSKKDFERWVITANTHPEDCEICIRIVSCEEIQNLNNQYRRKNKVTNVLSFPVGLEKNFQHPSDEPLYLGDIIICHDRIVSEAKAQHKKIKHHYAHMTIHGILHLLGYDHQTEDDADKMENIEINLLAQLKIENPYREVSQ